MRINSKSILAGMALGALLGSTLGGLTGPAVSVCLAIAAGALLYIAFGDLIPESKHGYHGRLSAVGGVLGVIFGLYPAVKASGLQPVEALRAD